MTTSPSTSCAARKAKRRKIYRGIAGFPLTIDHDTSDPMAILGLSMAAQAQAVTDPTEIAKALVMLPRKYPGYAAFPMPKPEETVVFRVVPKVISLLDYTKGFGNAELVTV